VLGVKTADQGLAGGLGRAVDGGRVQGSVLEHGPKVVAVSVRHDGREPDQTRKPVDARCFQDGDESGEVDVADAGRGIAQQHRAGDAAGVNDPLYAKADARTLATRTRELAAVEGQV
jgi:hypothetical protein